MHYHLEIIMPFTDDVEGAIATILEPFSEHDDENYHTFWDWYVIGGRWAGAHLEASVDQKKLDEFRQKLQEMETTVSSLQAGKQELNPPEQIPTVDALWREMFPESELNTCPLFNHFNNQYENSCLDADTLDALQGEMAKNLTAERVIVAAAGHEDKLRAEFMLTSSMWNGVTHQETTWNGNVAEALEQYKERISRYADAYKEKVTPTDDWLFVTVDYHS